MLLRPRSDNQVHDTQSLNRHRKSMLLLLSVLRGKMVAYHSIALSVLWAWQTRASGSSHWYLTECTRSANRCLDRWYGQIVSRFPHSIWF